MTSIQFVAPQEQTPLDWGQSQPWLALVGRGRRLDHFGRVLVFQQDLDALGQLVLCLGEHFDAGSRPDRLVLFATKEGPGDGVFDLGHCVGLCWVARVWNCPGSLWIDELVWKHVSVGHDDVETNAIHWAVPKGQQGQGQESPTRR